MDYKNFNIDQIELTKYLFFTGKGGVGKTSTACATAVKLADKGKNVMLVSTDPASNLQDVFDTKLNNKGVELDEVKNLVVANFDPEKAAEEYKENALEPYKDKLPKPVLKNMEEQLSGSCTVEIAAFNEFSNFITNEEVSNNYDHIIFDTAPTGHTLRMLELPSAWSEFIDQNTTGASCLGQLSGLEGQQKTYRQAVKNLANKDLTTLILVARPEETPLKEAQRASLELKEIGVENQMLIMNGILDKYDDFLSEKIHKKQKKALNNISDYLKRLKTYQIPLRPYNITGLDSLRSFFTSNDVKYSEDKIIKENNDDLKDIINDLVKNEKKVIFTMGKGGVGKTTIASSIALGLAKKGKKVHLTTTDPAAHLKFVFKENKNITLSSIDEKEELEKYKKEVMSQASEDMSPEDLDYLKEDLRSPCTQEIAVFRAFAEVVDKSEDEIVVIDTAPTGHTLLLLDSTQSYHKEIERSQGKIPSSVKRLLPKLRNHEKTEVIIVTLPEATPVYEAKRLVKDLKRANIYTKWWLINSSFYKTNTTNEILKVKASNEIKWINEVNKISNDQFAVIEWMPEDLKGEKLHDLIG